MTGNKLKGKVGKGAYLENWITTISSLIVGESEYDVTFEWEEEIGIPRAFMIKNNHHSQFFLKSLTLENVPGHGHTPPSILSATLGCILLTSTNLIAFFFANQVPLNDEDHILL